MKIASTCNDCEGIECRPSRVLYDTGKKKVVLRVYVVPRKLLVLHSLEI